MHSTSATRGLPGAAIGGALGGLAGGVLASAGLLDDPAENVLIPVLLAVQTHAIVTAAVVLALEDRDFLGGLGTGLIGLIYYGLALGYALALVWTLVTLFGDHGPLAFLNDLPQLLHYPLKLIVGLAVAGAWALFGIIVVGPAWRANTPDWVSGGLVVLILGGALSVVMMLPVVLLAAAVPHLTNMPVPPVNAPAPAVLVGFIYGAYQGYALDRYLTS